MVSNVLALYFGNNILAESESKEDDGGYGAAFGDDDPSWWNDEDLLMALDVGFDEGGGGDTLLISAQVGIVSKAKKFKHGWKRDLPTEIPYFHAIDYGNRDGGVFRGMDLSGRQKLLASLSGHVRRHLEFGFTGKVTLSNWNSQTDNTFRSQWGTAYSFAFRCPCS